MGSSNRGGGACSLLVCSLEVQTHVGLRGVQNLQLNVSCFDLNGRKMHGYMSEFASAVAPLCMFAMTAPPPCLQCPTCAWLWGFIICFFEYELAVSI